MIDGELAECLVRVDGNGEFACYSKPDERNPAGRVFFFPKDSDLREEVKRHNRVNAEKPIFAEDAPPLVDDELEAWLGGGDVAGDTDDEIAEDESATDAGPADDDE